MKKVVVLSGAGVSAESGIKTFRDSGGLWEGYDVMDVASIEGWNRNPELVLDFYNMRRKDALKAQPNQAHKLIAGLERDFDVTVVTQNVDNLHEKAGSGNVLHLHGELFKCRSTADENMIYDMEGWELKLGDKCSKGSQLRPHIVWFGEKVPRMQEAIMEAMKADIFIVVGTSLQVYPAAGLMNYVSDEAMVYVVDPNLPDVERRENLKMFGENASTGIAQVVYELRRQT